MRIVVTQKDVVVGLNKKIFLLGILENEKYALNNFDWNYGVLNGSEDVLMFYKNKLYFGEWVDSNIIFHETDDSDNLADYLSKLLPKSDRYFYLITSKFVLTLPKELLVNLPLVDDPLIRKYYGDIN